MGELGVPLPPVSLPPEAVPPGFLKLPEQLETFAVAQKQVALPSATLQPMAVAFFQEAPSSERRCDCPCNGEDTLWLAERNAVENADFPGLSNGDLIADPGE